MKPAPAPKVPGSTEAERMSNAPVTLKRFPKADLLKAAALKRPAKRKRSKRPRD